MIPQNRAVIRQMEITQQASLSLNSQLWVLPTNHDYAKPAYHDMPWAASFSSPTQKVKNIFLRKDRLTSIQESFWWNKSKENYFQFVSILIFLMS